MAHLVETMAWTGAKPWHGLGVEVDNNLSPEEIAAAASIDWPVEKLPVFQYFNGEFRGVDGRFNLTRMTDGKVLDIVGDVYKPVQNVDALDFFKRFVDAGNMTMETAGSLDGGRRIWGLASMKQGFTLAGGDQVNGYLLLCSPHKQGESFKAKLTTVRVVCNNTLTSALNIDGTGPAPGGWRMSHAKNFDADMKQAAAEALGLAEQGLHEFAEKAEFLSECKVRETQHLIDYVAALSGSKLLESAVEEAEGVNAAASGGSFLDAAIVRSENARQVRAMRETDLNKVGRTVLESILTSPGSELVSARGTWWGAVNGVTYAADHVLGKTADTRLTSAWFGDRANLKQQAVDLAVEFASGKN